MNGQSKQITPDELMRTPKTHISQIYNNANESSWTKKIFGLDCKIFRKCLEYSSISFSESTFNVLSQ